MNVIKQAVRAIIMTDYERAIALLEPLARQDNREAQFLLGYLFFTSAEVNQDESRAWLEMAAAQDHAEACCCLAWFGPSQVAQRWLRKAAELGSANAQRGLGVNYSIGASGLPVDAAEGRKWYTLAAEQGDVDAQYNLGMMWLDGEGGPINTETGLHWLTLAASQDIDNPTSEYAAMVLGDLYEYGTYGVQPDTLEAKQWWQRQHELKAIFDVIYLRASYFRSSPSEQE